VRQVVGLPTLKSALTVAALRTRIGRMGAANGVTTAGGIDTFSSANGDLVIAGMINRVVS